MYLLARGSGRQAIFRAALLLGLLMGEGPGEVVPGESEMFLKEPR